jgi:hypothetical protein
VLKINTKIIINFFKKYNEPSLIFAEKSFLKYFVNALQVWLGMNILFSFSSYGLSGYAWYLIAGFSVAITRLLPNSSSVAVTK